MCTKNEKMTKISLNVNKFVLYRQSNLFCNNTSIKYKSITCLLFPTFFTNLGVVFQLKIAFVPFEILSKNKSLGF